MTSRFDGSRVLITGAASGIGRATAERFASEGARIVIGDIDLDGAERAATELRAAHGTDASAVRFDAQSADSCRALVDHAATTLGGIDVLLNIAGMMGWGRLADYPDEGWERMLRINLSSLFYITKQALPHLIASKGAIVNVASAGGLIPVANTVAYGVSKAGVIALTKSTALEYGPHGVRANAIAPGGVMTPMHEKTMSQGVDPELVNEAASRNSPKLAGVLAADPAEIAEAIAYLASPAARFVSGTTLVIDGAQTCG